MDFIKVKSLNLPTFLFLMDDFQEIIEGKRKTYAPSKSFLTMPEPLKETSSPERDEIFIEDYKHEERFMFETRKQ